MKKNSILSFFFVCIVLNAQFTHVFQLPLDGKTESVTFAKKGEKPILTLSLKGNCVLQNTTAEQPSKLLEAPIPQGAKLLQLWFAADKTQLVFDQTIASTGQPAPALPPRPVFEAVPAPVKPLFQRLAPIHFQDDFARTDENDTNLWSTNGGRFLLNMSLNPGSSQGAFQFWGSSPKGEAVAIANTSKWFWRDGRYGVSTISSSKNYIWGIVIAHVAQDTFIRLELDHAAAQGRLVHRQNGKDTVLAQAPCRLTDAWTRAELLAANGAIAAFVEGKKLFQIPFNGTAAGSVGLYLRDTDSAFFDDVTVDSINVIPDTLPAPFGPCEQSWSDFTGKNFLTDPYMSQWAHPRSFWNDGPDNLVWFRSRLFSNIDFSWKKADNQQPISAFRIRFFTSQEKPEDGYLLECNAGKATLKSNGQQIAEATVPEQITELKLEAASSIAISFNGQPLIKHAASATNLNGFLAANLGLVQPLSQLSQPDWRDSALVSSSNRLDYSFEHAPTAWFPQIGSWKATHRWACVPRWSFFAGRGIPGPTEVKHGNAVLWNLRQITGDFDLEIFAAPMEGTPQRAHFTYPISINLAFGADGTSLDSGYNFVNGIYDFPSQLFLKDKCLATNNDRVVVGLRRHELFWYKRVTQVWQHIRVQRKNGRILVDSAWHDDHGQYYPLQRVFDQPDQLDAATPSQFALWTWGENGLAIARASLSFQNSPGAAAPPTAFPTPEIRHGDGKTEPAEYTRLTNPISGGQFSTVIYDKPIELNSKTQLKMLVRPSSGTHISLIATVNGQAAELPITGPKNKHRPYTFQLSQYDVQPVPNMAGWFSIKADIGPYASGHFPKGERLVVSSIAIASPYDSIEEIAGLGVNRAGATVDFTKMEITRSENIFDFLPPYRMANPVIHGHRIIQDFDDDFGDFQRAGGSDGAALLLANPDNGYTSGMSLRLLNQNVGGTAGAYLTQKPFTLDAFPKLAFDYAIPQGIEIELIAVTDEGYFEIDMTGTDNTWPQVGKIDIVHDGKWHHAEVDLAALLKPHLKAPFVVRKLLFADPYRMSSYQRLAWYLDNVRLVPAIANGTVISLDNPTVDSIAVALDNKPDTTPDLANSMTGKTVTVKLPEGGATWLHIAYRHTPQSAWSEIRHLPIVSSATPVNAAVPPKPAPPKPATPAAPLIAYIPSDCLVYADMETKPNENETPTTFGGLEIRREAWVLRNTDDAATGNACAEFINLNPDQGFYSIFLRKAPWDVSRWPCVSFNYRFKQPGCALNLSMLVNDAMTIVEWTNKNIAGGYFAPAVVGATEPFALQDDAWHETSFDLRDMLLKTRFTKGLPPTGLIAAELSTWATAVNGNGYVNPKDARLYIDNFTIYSNKGKNPAFTWSTTAADGGYAVVFDQKPDTVPEEKVTQAEATASFPNTAPGTWFLHVRSCSKANVWSPAAHKKIVIEP
ncbi:MAG: hypothetical protein K6G44_17210 [Lentisphaeria bacterium]|nr:hypothetical protein [Lentisphaeria bacterium]